LAVLDVIKGRGLVERVAEKGAALRDELEGALSDSEMVREVRGRGYLLGVELVDPRDRDSFLPDELDAATLVEQTALEKSLLVLSSHSTPDGFTGDHVLLAPAYVSTDAELQEMVQRVAETIADVERTVKASLGGTPVEGRER
jgi:adenosylmethionine-8-amino-7-oxononanoate aminotransferase